MYSFFSPPVIPVNNRISKSLQKTIWNNLILISTAIILVMLIFGFKSLTRFSLDVFLYYFSWFGISFTSKHLAFLHFVLEYHSYKANYDMKNEDSTVPIRKADLLSEVSMWFSEKSPLKFAVAYSITFDPYITYKECIVHVCLIITTKYLGI